MSTMQRTKIHADGTKTVCTLISIPGADAQCVFNDRGAIVQHHGSWGEMLAMWRELCATHRLPAF